MKRLLIISALFFSVLVLVPETSYAQLVTDSDKKLKTSKKKQKSSGFISYPESSQSPFQSFKKKKVYPKYTTINRGSLFRSKKTAPRYSMSGPGSMFAQESFTPRYSQPKPFTKRDFQKGAPLSGSGSPFRNSKFTTYPRYSAGNPFSNKRQIITPSYSAGSPFRNKRYDNARYPREEAYSPFKNASFTVSPRYSVGSPFSNKRKSVTPMYSTGSPFGNKRNSVSPAYSIGSPFSNKRNTISPAYSMGSPFGNKRQTVNPAYSMGSPFGNKRNTVSPAYSYGSPFGNKRHTISPAYSVGSPFGNKRNAVSPKYSTGSPFKDMRFGSSNPRYSTTKNRFEWNERYRNQTRPADYESPNYKGTHRKKKAWYAKLDNVSSTWQSGNFKGPVKTPAMSKERYKEESSDASHYEGSYKEKWINNHSMHPSFAHHRASSQDSDFLRESLRKWNLFMARLNGNKEQPDAVKDKISKPKFDRKETDIWNN